MTLTPAERRLAIEFAISPCSNAELAKRLGLGLGTVKSHMGSCFTKCGVHDRAALVAYMWRTQLIRYPARLTETQVDEPTFIMWAAS